MRFKSDLKIGYELSSQEYEQVKTFPSKNKIKHFIVKRDYISHYDEGPVRQGLAGVLPEHWEGETSLGAIG